MMVWQGLRRENIASMSVSHESAVVSSDANDGAPVGLRVDPRTIDFGSHLIGEMCRKTAVLTNESREEIWIHKISSSCGCMSTFTEEFVLRPGEHRELSFEIDTSRKEPGKFNGQYTISVLQGNRWSSVAIPVRADLDRRGLLVCDPAAISFGRVQVGHPVKFRVNCKCDDTNAVSSTQKWEVQCPPWLSGQVNQLADNNVNIDFEGLAPKSIGNLRGIALVTRNGRTSEIAISGIVVGAVSFDAEQLVRVLNPGESASEFELLLSHAQGKDFALSSIHYEGMLKDSFKVQTTPSKAGVQLIHVNFDFESIKGTQVVTGALLASCSVDGDELKASLPLIIVRR
jgi:hypothetical protein